MSFTHYGFEPQLDGKIYSLFDSSLIHEFATGLVDDIFEFPSSYALLAAFEGALGDNGCLGSPVVMAELRSIASSFYPRNGVERSSNSTLSALRSIVMRSYSNQLRL